ncbi:MAG: 2TM domain-containing protein [Dehalococcoidia bacterium]
MSEEELYKLARKRVEDKKGFYQHFVTYAVVNIVLVIIWAFPSGGGYPWFLWILGGWGIAILSQFLRVFVFSGGAMWEKRQIEKEVEKLKRGGN